MSFGNDDDRYLLEKNKCNFYKTRQRNSHFFLLNGFYDEDDYLKVLCIEKNREELPKIIIQLMFEI